MKGKVFAYVGRPQNLKDLKDLSVARVHRLDSPCWSYTYDFSKVAGLNLKIGLKWIIIALPASFSCESRSPQKLSTLDYESDEWSLHSQVDDFWGEVT